MSMAYAWWAVTLGCGGSERQPLEARNAADASLHDADVSIGDVRVTEDWDMPAETHRVELDVTSDSDGSDTANATDARGEAGLLNPPSCAGGLDCGGVSCCGSIAVPGGSFTAGNNPGDKRCPITEECPPDEAPAHLAKVSPFALDAFEVTVGRFRKFLDAYDAWLAAGNPVEGTGSLPGYSDPLQGSGWYVPEYELKQGAGLPLNRATFVAELNGCTGLTPEQGPTWSDSSGPDENLPMSCLKYYEAFAFCIWDGGRLPTEAEWEYVATGGEELRRYPWGDEEPDCVRVAYNATPPCGARAPHLVGSHPSGQGRWGHMDLAGNVAEWIRDGDSWYTGAPCIDCIAGYSNRRAIGGSDYEQQIAEFRATARGGGFPWSFAADRCPLRPRPAWMTTPPESLRLSPSFLAPTTVCCAHAVTSADDETYRRRGYSRVEPICLRSNRSSAVGLRFRALSTRSAQMISSRISAPRLTCRMRTA